MAALNPNHTQSKSWTTYDLSLVVVSAIVGVLVLVALIDAPMLAVVLATRRPIALAATSAVAVTAPALLDLNAGTPDVLERLDGGVPQPYSNGSETAISDDLRARVVVSGSSVGQYQRDLDVFIYRNDSQSTPVTRVGVQAWVIMRGMTDGGFTRAARPVGDGHYLLPIQLTMAGSWQIELRVAAVGKSTEPIDLVMSIWH